MRSLNSSSTGRREQGAAAVEFVLVSLVLFPLLFGLFDIARLYRASVAVQSAAREAARYAVTGRVGCTGYTDNRSACIVQSASQATSGLQGGGVNGSAVTVSVRSWDYTGATTSPWSATAVSNFPGRPCDQVEVSVKYKYTYVFPLVAKLRPTGQYVTGTQRLTVEPNGPCM